MHRATRTWSKYGPYKRDYILQQRLIIFRSLLIIATPYRYGATNTCSYSDKYVQVERQIRAGRATNTWRDKFVCFQSSKLWVGRFWISRRRYIYICRYIYIRRSLWSDIGSVDMFYFTCSNSQNSQITNAQSSKCMCFQQLNLCTGLFGRSLLNYICGGFGE